MASGLRVLFVCTGNSARSQMAEALLRRLTGGRADVHSAGTTPRQEVHPIALRVLKSKFGIDISEQRPKDLDVYAGQSFDYVFTLCDKAVEACPTFPSDPEMIRWSFPDPAAVEGPLAEQERAFERIAGDIAGRLRIWMALRSVTERLNAVETS